MATSGAAQITKQHVCICVAAAAAKPANLEMQAALKARSCCNLRGGDSTTTSLV